MWYLHIDWNLSTRKLFFLRALLLCLLALNLESAIFTIMIRKSYANPNWNFIRILNFGYWRCWNWNISSTIIFLIRISFTNLMSQWKLNRFSTIFVALSSDPYFYCYIFLFSQFLFIFWLLQISTTCTFSKSRINNNRFSAGCSFWKENSEYIFYASDKSAIFLLMDSYISCFILFVYYWSFFLVHYLNLLQQFISCVEIIFYTEIESEI